MTPMGWVPEVEYSPCCDAEVPRLWDPAGAGRLHLMRICSDCGRTLEEREVQVMPTDGGVAGL